MKKLRIGFLSTANIGRTNWQAIAASRHCVVSAVASRELARSRKFISECQRAAPLGYIPEAFGSYHELLASERVDAVYVPLPTAMREEIIVRAADAGKHVLCEKPCASNAGELEAMISACKKNRVQFMDGVMFMHNARMAKIRKELDAGSIGRIKRITSQFSFCGSKDFHRSNIRVNGALEPLGCLGDLGWYCIRITLWTMKWQMPRRIEARLIAGAENDSKVPVEFSGELFFDGGVSAAFYCSFLTGLHQWVDVSGTDGHLQLDGFVRPPKAPQLGFELNHRLVKTSGAWDAQQVNMFDNFARQIFSGKLNEEWPVWSLKTQQVTNACLEAAHGGEN